MKRILALLIVLASVCYSFAQNQINYATGAWWTTKAPTPQDKTAGALDVYFYDDGTIEVDVWFDGDIIDTVDGTWQATRTANIVTFTVVGNNFRGILQKTGFCTGSFKSTPTGSYAGKWQVAIPKN